MNLATLLFQTPAPIQEGIGRIVTMKTKEDDIIEKPRKKFRKCTGCGVLDNGDNFYRLGSRCKACQKMSRCLA